jgi:hypothetical protein
VSISKSVWVLAYQDMPEGSDKSRPITIEEHDGKWYHYAGGVRQREATSDERLYPMWPTIWVALAKREGWL